MTGYKIEFVNFPDKKKTKHLEKTILNSQKLETKKMRKHGKSF